MEQVPDSPDNQHPVKTDGDYEFIGYSLVAEKVSKNRDPYFSNLKFILIFLVILGHLIEKYIYVNHDLYSIYTVIYMVHMPLFAFISGFFSKNSYRKLNRIWKIGGLFFLLHLGWLLVNLLLTGDIGDWKTPYWYFWYLLSLFCWKWMGIFLQFINRRVLSKMNKIFRISVVITTIILGCFSGVIWWIGRNFSLSRTLVFFPFYYIGLRCSMKVINRIKNIRLMKKLLISATAFIIAFILGSLLMRFVPITFLHHAEGFKALNLSISLGIHARLISYIIAASLGLAILALTPSKELWFSKFGADTFPVYISHGLLMPANIFAPTSTLVSLLYFTVFILGFIYLVYWIVHLGSNLKLKLHL